jgi:hypothetical protein
MRRAGDTGHGMAGSMRILLSVTRPLFRTTKQLNPASGGEVAFWRGEKKVYLSAEDF